MCVFKESTGQENSVFYHNVLHAYLKANGYKRFKYDVQIGERIISNIRTDLALSATS